MRTNFALTTDPDRRPSWLRRNMGKIDIIAALAAAGISILVLFATESSYPKEYGKPGLLVVIFILLSTLPLAVRRRFPISVAIFMSVAYMTGCFVTPLLVFGPAGTALLAAMYTLGAHVRVFPGILVPLGNAVVNIVFLTVYAHFPLLSDHPLNLALAMAQYLLLWGIGRAVGSRRLYLDGLQAKADDAERAKAAEVRAALAEERARVARELHDVVAHHVSVMTVQATAAQRALDRRPEKARDAMRNVEETGRAALNEMRRIVGALRSHESDGGAELNPQAGVQEIGILLDRSRDGGLNANLSVIGTPTPLPKGVDLAIYRVVQEALTNSLRYSPSKSAHVEVRYDPSEVAVTVTDEGNGRPVAPPQSVGGGHGLVGMRERVALNGGTLYAGPRTEGGFRVEARIPLQARASNGSTTGRPSRPSVDEEPDGTAEETAYDETSGTPAPTGSDS